MGKSYTDPYAKATAKGQVEVRKLRGLAELKERIQPPCGACGRKTYRLNAQHDSVCFGCDEDDVLCECSPLQKIGTQLIG
jgi:hypothetical protein